MTKIIKKDGKTIVKTDQRIDTLNAAQFETDIQPALEKGVDLEIDCSELNYLASSGLRVLQSTMRTVRSLNGQMKISNVDEEIFNVLRMVGFTRYITVERAAPLRS